MFGLFFSRKQKLKQGGMLESVLSCSTAVENEVPHLLGERAGILFASKKMCCSEAALVVLNEFFQGGLSGEQAVRIGSAFCGGMGNAGCICGALSGAEAGLGLVLGVGSRADFSQKKVRALAKELHDRFTAQSGSACCRALIEPFGKDQTGRRDNCRRLTELATAIAATLIMESWSAGRSILQTQAT